MATTQEKATPCCIDTSKSSSSSAPPPLLRKASDWALTASDPSKDPIRKTPPVAALIRPVESLSVPDHPANTSSTKGSLK